MTIVKKNNNLSLASTASGDGTNYSQALVQAPVRGRCDALALWQARLATNINYRLRVVPWTYTQYLFKNTFMTSEYTLYVLSYLR